MIDTVLKERLKIGRLSVSRLLKTEVAELAEEVLRIVKSHDPEAMQIKAMHDLLEAQRPLFESLKTRYGVDPYRLDMKPAREKMVLLASNFKLQVRLLSKSYDPKELHAIVAAKKRYLRHLYRSKNTKILKQKIAGFIDDAENDARLRSDIEQFGLNGDVLKLKVALEEVRAIAKKRNERYSKQLKMTSREVKGYIYGAIEHLFKEIEVAQLREPDVDYVPIINTLNVLVKKYKTLISRRKHHNQRKAAKRKAAEAKLETTSSDATISTSEIVSKSDKNGADNEALRGNEAYLPAVIYNQIGRISPDG
ncbi:MAG TPA: DUF6261 family protein [Dysgonamonadaceae bacterium]|nr:DUF6261 family protein [Dysgonamonadaceae bacterium]